MSPVPNHLSQMNAPPVSLLAICASIAFLPALPAHADEKPSGDDANRRVIPAQRLSALPAGNIEVDLGTDEGLLEAWRHGVGHGGVNSVPLPDRVVKGIAKVRPRWIRIFIQEFFSIYPERGKLDWSRLDPYMDAFSRTGAKVVAAITIKPKPLYPQIDQRIWRPTDGEEWQRVVAALVKRYSVDKPIVSHWEVGNECDIGEAGGCPYLIEDPAEYAEYYKLTIAPILAAFPGAKVGGPAVANAGGEYLGEFVRCCRKERLRLDFISWHAYADDPDHHARLVGKHRKLLEGFSERAPEMFVTEWSKGFDPISVEDMAFDPRRAAAVAASIVTMTDARVDGSFYYHLWDQAWYFDDFKPFFQDLGLMYRHWNEAPHRFGLFGVGGEVRPQFFVFEMLARMAERRARIRSDTADLRALASVDDRRVTVLIANYGLPESRERIVNIRFSGLSPGRRELLVYRIDRDFAWSSRTLELLPREGREVDVKEQFACQVYSPADSVALVVLEKREGGRSEK